MEITGRTVLIYKNDNLWGFEMDTPNGKVLLGDKHFSSSIAIAIDEIAEAMGLPKIKEGKTVRITVEEVD